MDNEVKNAAPAAQKAEPAKRKRRAEKPTPPKLKLIFLVVPRPKSELYAALLQSFEINAELIMAASGTASSETLEYLGLSNSDKCVIIGTVREDRCAEVMKFIGEKFSTIKNGGGIAFTSPMTGLIGVTAYKFLSNQ